MKIFHTQRIFLVLFMSGFLFGIIFANLAANNYLTDARIINEYELTEFANENKGNEEFVVYLIFLRLIPFAILFALSYSRIRKLIVFAFLTWTGFSCGLLMAMEIISIGISGIMLYFAGILPQYLFYVPAYVILLWNMYTSASKKWSASKVGVMAAFMVIGIVLEGYVNPFCLKWIIKKIW